MSKTDDPVFNWRNILGDMYVNVYLSVNHNN